jgi:glycerol uptake facilitator-like aquaporin
LQELISTSVSLAGFILAALTIIVTFKSNLKAKSIENSDNALDLIFSTGHYDNIVRVFKSSIIELVFCFVALFIVWASTDNLDVIIINKVNVCAILLTSFAIVRSLMVLFMILSLDGLNRE